MGIPRKLWHLLTGLLVLGVLLGSCAPAAQPAPAPTKAPAVTAPTPAPARPTLAPAAAAEKPQYGGILNIATYTDAPSYDAHQETTIGTLLPVAPTYNGIVQYSPEDNTKVISDLAEKWEVSPDGLTYTFQFAKGVKWHDGKPFTAADAKFTLDRIRKPPQGMSSVRRDNFVGINDVVVVDDNTLKVTLKYPMASFVPLVAMGWNVVVPKHVVEPLGGRR